MRYYDLPPKDLAEYAGLDEASKLYPLVKLNGAIRFKTNPAMYWIMLNIDWDDLWARAQIEHWDIEDMRQIYRQMGVSLYWFMAIFGNEGELSFFRQGRPPNFPDWR